MYKNIGNRDHKANANAGKFTLGTKLALNYV